MVAQRIIAAVAIFMALAGGARAAPPEPGITVTLAPIAAPDSADRIGTVAVTLRFEGLATATGAPVLRLPLVTSNVDTVATVMTDFAAADAAGPVRLNSRDVDLPEAGMRDAVGGGLSREWLADRPIRGTLTVRYIVPAQASLPPRGPAPPFSFSADGGGVSAAGHMFLLLPPGKARYRTVFDWDLRRAPAGSRGVSSLGEGRRTASQPLDNAQLRMSFFMAGRIGTWPAQPPVSGFFGAWQGSPCFDAKELLAWTGNLYDHYVGFFGRKDEEPYGVFLRHNPINAGGGVGLHRAFVTTFGKDSCENIGKIRLTLAHEMFHTFQPFITEPGGLESSWFGEGLATFYQARLPFRFGLLATDQYIADVNWTAARYYTSIMARLPNREVPKRFWADTRVRTLPYDRGMLYFAALDDELRKASRNKHSLDDLIMEMLNKQKSGVPTRNSDWEELLKRYLGDGAIARFRAFLDGEMPLPASDAFGPCFRRVSIPLRRYELGFEPAILAEPKRVVRGLIAHSAAARAGLRDGDEIVDPVPQDGIQGDQSRHLHLRVRRGVQIFSLDYLPRGGLVDAWQWEYEPSLDKGNCLPGASQR